MDAFVDTLIQLLIDWGYAGLFISALLAGSIVPFSSELVMIALVKVGLSPAICVLAATLGNTAGGMTCYYMGRLGKTDWIEKYFKVKKKKIHSNNIRLSSPLPAPKTNDDYLDLKKYLI